LSGFGESYLDLERLLVDVECDAVERERQELADADVFRLAIAGVVQASTLPGGVFRLVEGVVAERKVVVTREHEAVRVHRLLHLPPTPKLKTPLGDGVKNGDKPSA